MQFVQYARLALFGALASIAAGASPALAVSSSLATADATCPAGSLGVERVVDVDTTGGPWFGSPHGDPDFLRPGEVVLTFDDGPSPKDTSAILAALAKECTKATFFVVGSMVALHPEMVAEIAKQGHTIGTHTWSHANLAALPIAQATQQIESAIDAAQKASPTPIAPFFRYPYLASNKQTVAYLQSRNIAQFAIDVDSLDWRIHNQKAMVKKVMAGLKKRGRGIILMHDIHKSTAAALPELLTEIKAGGYKVVQLKPKEPVQVIAGVSPPPALAHVHTHHRTLKHRRTASQTKKTTPAQITLKTFWN